LSVGRAEPRSPQGAIARQRRLRERSGLCASWSSVCQSGKKAVCLKKTRCFADPEPPAGSMPASPTESQEGPTLPRTEIDRPRAASRGVNPTLPVGVAASHLPQAPRDQPGSQRTDPFSAAEVIKDNTADLKRGNCKRCAKLLIGFPHVGFGPRSTDTPARLKAGGRIRKWLSARNQRDGHL
jgi:hypothetical protein